LPFLEDLVRAQGLSVMRSSLCAFPLIPRLFRPFRPDVYNSSLAARTDALLSALFAWNVNYHPRSILQRLRPTSVYLLLRKPPG
jgi:hypothetical protein